MVFSGVVFLFAFLPALLLAYYVPLGRTWRNAVLLAFSLLFYSCGGWRLMPLILLSIGVNYLCGLLAGSARTGVRRAGLLAAAVFDVGMLAVFKYTGFLLENLSRLFPGLPEPEIVLPIGISFYTFQSLSYVIDVFRRQEKPARNPLHVALYIVLFPQLIAGPIVRYTDVARDITDRRESLEDLAAGIQRFLFGLAKKVLLANAMGEAADAVFTQQPALLSTGMAWLGVAAYTAQIYFDFSGYSDMAIGLGRMFGFHFGENFRYPYVSQSVTEFWRRWHISLSSWFKDYLYFPLGGSRCGKARRILNLLIVFTVSGLWHGAALTFVAWGLLNGLYQAVSILLRPVRDRLFKLLRVPERAWWLTALRVLFTFSLTCLAWVLFRANSLTDAMTVYSAVFRWMANIPRLGLGLSLGDVGISKKALLMLGVFSVGMLGADWFICNKDLWRRLNGGVVLRYAVYFLLMVFILIFGSYGSGYDPQDFVYFQF